MFSRSVFAVAVLHSAIGKRLRQASPNYDLNEQPVIGIVSQGIDSDFANDPRFEGYDSYIMAAYVKFMEAAGARVVPLVWNEPEEVTMNKLSQLDGVLFPGGANSYIEYGGRIIERIMQYNDEGHFYPAWGTCLGYEALMTWASSAPDDILEVYNAHAISLPLSFLEKPETTKMFADLGDKAYKFEEDALALNSHSYGVDPLKFVTDKGIASMYKLTSVSYEPAGEKRPFAATIEGINYPFYGTAFHPEKTMAMYVDNAGINHSWESI